MKNSSIIASSLDVSRVLKVLLCTPNSSCPQGSALTIANIEICDELPLVHSTFKPSSQHAARLNLVQLLVLVSRLSSCTMRHGQCGVYRCHRLFAGLQSLLAAHAPRRRARRTLHYPLANPCSAAVFFTSCLWMATKAKGRGSVPGVSSLTTKY